MKALRSRIQAEVRRTSMPHTTDEPVVLGVQTRPLLHGYGEVLDALLSCYRLEEVIAEKLRALLQVQRQREERGWSRSRVRDYYDIWRIIREHENSLDCDCLPELLLGKCGHRDVSFASLDDFFADSPISDARENWTIGLCTILR